MKKLHKITILLMLVMLCMVAFVGCNTLPTDDSGLKKRGYNMRVTFNGDGGMSGNASEIYVYLLNPEYADENSGVKDGSPVPKPGSNIISGFLRSGFEFQDWYYTKIDPDTGDTIKVIWDFEKDRVYPGREGVEWDEASGLYNLVLYPDWTRVLSYKVVCIADDGDRYVQYFTLKGGRDYSDSGFSTLLWSSHTRIPDFEYTGYYRDEALTDEIESYAMLSEGNDYPTEEDSVYTIYTRWISGSCSFISEASQLDWKSDNYYLLNDIDFTDCEYTFPTGAFTGKIIGNGYKISNINATYQVGYSDSGASIGLFGELNGATIRDVVFENCTLNIEYGAVSTMRHDVGFIAGRVRNGSSVIGVSIINGKINISNTTGDDTLSGKLSYNAIEEYMGAFNDIDFEDNPSEGVSSCFINNIYADITIYDPDNLGN